MPPVTLKPIFVMLITYFDFEPAVKEMLFKAFSILALPAILFGGAVPLGRFRLDICYSIL